MIEPKAELKLLLVELQKTVKKMSNLYQEHDELNDEVDIQKIIPRSLDEWECMIEEVNDNIEL
jgi:hypothetical protein